MIIVCPACARRYRIDDGRLGDGARRVRCTGCGQIFAAMPQAASIAELKAAIGHEILRECCPCHQQGQSRE